jgi:topoisomerase-4 subunit A
VYFDGIKERFMVKRFELEPRGDGWECFITEHAKSALHVLTAADRSTVSIRFRKVKGKERDDEQLVLEEFIAVKGWKALGNMLHAGPVLHVQLVSAERDEPEVEESVAEEVALPAGTEGLAPGTTVEWSDLAQAPSITGGASEPDVDFGTEDDGQITLNF